MVRRGVLVRAIAAIALATGGLVAVPVTAAAAPALSGYQIVVSPTAAVPPRGAVGFYAECPDGTHVTGGGISADAPPDPRAVVWLSSYPAKELGRDRWFSQVNNTGQVAFSVRAYAVCLGGLTQYQVQRSPIDIAAGSTAYTFTGCSGTPPYEFGGGFDVETGWGHQISGIHMTRTSTGEHRGFNGSNTSTQTQRWAAYAACGSGGMAEVQTVTTPWLERAPGIALLDVTCPAGMSVLGGGGGGFPGSAVIGSYPLSSTQWRTVQRIDGSTTGKPSQAWATCAR